MNFSWTSRILGLCLGGMLPAWGLAQEPFSALPTAPLPAWQEPEAPPDRWPAAPVSFNQPARLPAPHPNGVPVSAASYHNLLERIQALEEDKQKKEEEEERLKEVETILKPTQEWSGRIHFDYWPIPGESALPNYLETGDADEGPGDFIGFRRLRFGVQGDINETMLYRLEMEFAGGNDVSFKDAYLGWDELPILQTVLLGNQKRPYGLDHINSSRYNVFMERPFTNEAFNQDARRVGLQSYGISENQAWNWRYGYFLMEDLADVGNQRTDNYQSEIAGRLANTIWYDETSGGRGYAHWAVSGSLAFPGGGPDGRFRTRPEARTDARWFDTGVLDAHNYQLLGLEGVINLGAFSVVAEYQTTHVNRYDAADTNFGGGYVYVAYWLTGEYTPWDREMGMLDRTEPLENFWLVNRCDGGVGHGWGAWQVAARYSHGDFTDEDILGGVGNAGTLALNWWWNPYARLQFNYINGHISERVVAGAPSDEGWYQIFGMRFMVDF